MGYFKAYRTVKDMFDDKDCLATFHNTFVDSGKIYSLDRIWRISDWHSVGDDNIYMRVGINTNTNADVVGPTPSTPIAINGSWQGVAPNDWKLTDELETITPSTVQIIRSGKTVHCYATFTTTGSDKEVYEIGIFLGNGGGVTPRYPRADPSTGGVNDDKQNGMLCRAVNYYSESSEYKTAAMTITTTEGLVIRYMFDDFEG